MAFKLLGIHASPSPRSRSASLLQWAQTRLEAHASRTTTLTLRELPAQALLLGDTQAAPIRAAVQGVAEADVLIIATPIYKAAYSGLLKVFLDLLPTDALRGKTVLPLATGGSLAHLLALDYAVKPLLWTLGARHILDGVYATDGQLTQLESGAYLPDDELVLRLERAIEPLTGRHRPVAPAPSALLA
jgi:FMN reductase